MLAHETTDLPNETGDKSNALLTSLPLERSGKRIQVVIKVAERCNIACTYCYFFFSSDQSYKEHPPVIPLSKSQDILAFLERSLVAERYDELFVIFHGGEPLLAPLPVLEGLTQGVMAFQERGLVPRVLLGIQTNGMLLTDKKIEFLHKYNFGVGISLDGDKALNDEFRIDHKGRGTYDRTIAGYYRYKNFQEARGRQGPGILSVAHPSRDARATLHHFYTELGCKGLDFLLPDWTYDDAIVDQAYVEGIETFLIDMFWAWVEANDPNLRIRFIDDILYPLVFDDLAASYPTQKTSYFKILSISSDGTVAPEDTLKLIDPSYQNVGNVNDFETIEDVYKTPPFLELIDSIESPPPKCASCEWFGSCVGDKTINRKSAANGLNNPSIYCTALQALREEIASWLVESGHDIDAITRRLSLWKTYKPSETPALESAA